MPRSTLDALADAGLLGTALDPPAAQRELGELLAGADATTWFTWVQHQTPLRTLEGSATGLLIGAPSGLADELLPGMRSGRLLAAVAFAHVRRPGPPNPVATRVDGGWRLDGELDWVTSWDMADVVMVMAQGEGARQPTGSSAATCRPGALARRRRESSPDRRWSSSRCPARTLVRCASTGSTSPTAGWAPCSIATPGCRRTRCARPMRTRPRSAWPAERLPSSTSSPSVVTTTRCATSSRPSSDECRTVRAAAYAAADAGAPTADRLGLRAASLDLAVRAATSVVIARSGAAMRRGCSAERRLREAMFLQVQAQTAATRQASLALMRTRALADPDVQ